MTFEKKQIKSKIQYIFERIIILKNFFDYNKKKKRIEEINQILEQPYIWKKIKQIEILNKERSFLNTIINNIDQLIKKNEDIKSLLELALEINDEEAYNEISFELNQLQNKLIELEFHRMFSKEYDISNCYIDLQAGSGGIEAQDWTNMLLRMYLRWADSKELKTEIIEESFGDITGIKSATIKIIGNYAYGWLRTETGIHRLVRKSPFDSCKRRHTSFSSVFIYPEIDNKINIEINLSDLRIDVYRSSGAGGQHVNKTESAVRITHIPTNIVTQCQNDRSQHKNKDQAMNQLKAKLYKLEIQKKNENKQAIEKNKLDICWGNQIRSYILDDARIKDLRTGIETRNIQSVLDGDLDKFIKGSLKIGL
ncbi:peptide chain release factor 2 [Candidatus Providencia siddallii]|uniref:Peptide chain release factor 2 n=1 Tax=Candidatus Providencia siddallii TaxID=1715285 RepID=A0ABM9NPM3_9GAMM